MDEPLSNLDAKLRTQMRAEIGLLHKEIGVTTIYVTHDQVEAMTLGQRVAVMRKGELQQVAAPAGALHAPGEPLRRRLHRQPGDELLRGRVERRERRLAVTFGDGQRLAVDDAERALPAGSAVDDGTAGRRRRAARAPRGRRARAGDAGGPAAPRARPPPRAARLGGRRPLRGRGGAGRHRGDARDRRGRRRVRADRARPSARGAADVVRRPLRGRRADRGGTVAEIAVAPGALRFFDPETGARIGA